MMNHTDGWVLYEIHKGDLADVSIGDAFNSLLRAGSRNGVHNPGEFFLLTRAFVILELMIRQHARYPYRCVASRPRPALTPLGKIRKCAKI